MKLYESFSDLAWDQALLWGKRSKKKKGGQSEEGDKGAALSPSRPVHRSAPFARRFFVVVSYRCFFSVFVLVFALFPTTEPVLRQTLFFPFQILISYLWINVLQMIAARKGNANVGVSA